MKNKEIAEKTIEFPLHKEVEPEDLIIFKEEYLEHLREVMNYVSKNEGRLIRLIIGRVVYSEGSFSQKSIWGIPHDVKNELGNESFILSIYEKTPEPEKDDPTEKGEEILIRPRNVLGVLPFLTSSTIENPFEENSLTESKDFFQWLPELRKFLESFVGTDHVVNLFYKYTKRCPSFRNGNYHVEGKILKVNLSNVEYEHYGTFSFSPDGEKYVSLGKRTEVDRFIAPDRYLWKVVVFPKRTNTLTSWDDGESCEKLVILNST